MARVTIRVECDGGSTTEIVEQSLASIYGGEQAALLVREAFVRVCGSLGVQPQNPAPVEAAPRAAVPEPAATDKPDTTNKAA